MILGYNREQFGLRGFVLGRGRTCETVEIVDALLHLVSVVLDHLVELTNG